MPKIEPKYKIIQAIIGDEIYRTDTSNLLAYNPKTNIYLFRALNSNYFIQDDNRETIKLIDIYDAEVTWVNMPHKRVVDKVAAFPMIYGGIGLDTYTNLYDD